MEGYDGTVVEGFDGTVMEEGWRMKEIEACMVKVMIGSVVCYSVRC